MQLPKLYAQTGSKRAIDLTLSVNPLGCSPRVLKLLPKITMADISSYPDSKILINKLTQRFRVNENNLLLGCGSEQLIKLIAQTFCTAKGLAVMEQGSFAVFTKECLLAKAKVVAVNLEKMLQLPNPQIIFLANPKTPTGEIIDQNFMIKLAQKFTRSILVIDEANGEFIDESFIARAVKSKNTLVLRTFSKAWGLAGLRIGAVIGPATLIEKLTQAQQPFPVPQIAIKLALAALSDQKFIDKTKLFVTREREFLTSQLQLRGMSVSRSITNNLFIKVP
ncbi:MAG: histidinol-phosphate transaminase, partial [Patescibacteria group bacterium]